MFQLVNCTISRSKEIALLAGVGPEKVVPLFIEEVSTHGILFKVFQIPLSWLKPGGASIMQESSLLWAGELVSHCLFHLSLACLFPVADIWLSEEWRLDRSLFRVLGYYKFYGVLS